MNAHYIYKYIFKIMVYPFIPAQVRRWPEPIQEAQDARQ